MTRYSIVIAMMEMRAQEENYGGAVTESLMVETLFPFRWLSDLFEIG